MVKSSKGLRNDNRNGCVWGGGGEELVWHYQGMETSPPRGLSNTVVNFTFVSNIYFCCANISILKLSVPLLGIALTASLLSIVI